MSISFKFLDSNYCIPLWWKTNSMRFYNDILCFSWDELQTYIYNWKQNWFSCDKNTKFGKQNSMELCSISQNRMNFEHHRIGRELRYFTYNNAPYYPSSTIKQRIPPLWGKNSSPTYNHLLTFITNSARINFDARRPSFSLK